MRAVSSNISKARLLAGLFACGLAVADAGTPPASLESACHAYAQRLQSVELQHCLAAGLQLTPGRSVRGQPLLIRNYPPSNRHVAPRRVLLLAGIHGDELSSVSIAFQWMRRLELEPFRPFAWRVIPCVNPDGLMARPATRTNARGVDLNRNFPSGDWSREALAYWTRKTGRDPRRYPGPTALSEPETRWLLQQIDEFRPDAVVSIHAPFDLLDYDGPEQPPSQFGSLRLRPLGTYPGSMGNFAGIDIGVPVITLELPHAGILPALSQSQRIWGDMLGWLEQNLPARQPPAYPRLALYPGADR